MLSGTRFLGDEPCIVSLVSYDGLFQRDITPYMVSGSFTRVKNNVSVFDGEFVADGSIWDDRIEFWRSFIRVERDGRDQWEGPITNIVESLQDSRLKIVASGMSVFWARATMPNFSFDGLDVVDVAYSVLERVFWGHVTANCEYRRVPKGKLVKVEYLAVEDVVVADAFRELAGLDYFEFGRTIYLFSADPFPVPQLRLNDESFVVLPEVEAKGELYANQVVVKGSGVRGYAEASVDEIGFYGRLVRRFEYPNISVQASADSKAREILGRTRDSFYVNFGGDSMLSSSVPIGLDGLLPGMYVQVDHFVSRRSLSRMFRLESVKVDCVKGTVSVVLEPVGSSEIEDTQGGGVTV